MTRYRLDEQIAAALAAFPDEMASAPTLPPGDWSALRTRIDEEYAAIQEFLPPVPEDVVREDLTITAQDGTVLPARWYSRGHHLPGSGVVYAHGGGMVGGRLDDYERMIGAYVSQSGVPFLSVEYRLSPEVRGPKASEDLLASVQWLGAISGRGVDSRRVAVMGDSAGGGVVASAAILARELGVDIARQILIYPMLDDRVTTASPALAPHLVWSAEMNATGWAARVDEDVTPATSPARLVDFAGLAEAYIEVGDLDLFRDESLDYAARLARADVPIELHVHPSAPHGYDVLAIDSDLARRVMQDRIRVLESL